MDMINTIIGKNLKLLREHAGYNQKSIADFLNVDQSLVSKIEAGERSITSDMLEKLATLFDVNAISITQENPPLQTFSCAFRSSDLTPAELNAICDINRIALNSEFMQHIMEAQTHD